MVKVEKSKGGSNEEEMQRLAFQMQELRIGAESAYKQREKILDEIEELSITIAALREIKKIKEPQSTFIEIGGGNFIQGTVNPTAEIFVNAGSGIIIKRSIDEALEINEKRRKHLESAAEKLTEEIQRMSLMMRSLESRAQELVRPR
jgi:prefoldin alpha subunit